MSRALSSTPPRKSSASAKIHLRLYIAGQTEKSLRAFANLELICNTHLSRRYYVEVIDLSKTPELAARDQIFALPTLVRRLPKPIRKIIGDLSDESRVLVGLDLATEPS